MSVMYLKVSKMRVYNQLFPKIIFFLFSFIILFVSFSKAQHVSGDFRSVGDGFWSEHNVWEVYNGTDWEAAEPDQIPAKENAVFINGSTDIVLDISAVCYNLHIDKDASLNLDTETLEVFGY